MSSRSFITTLSRLAREADRQAKARQREAQAQERRRLAQLKVEQRATQLLNKQERADYLARRQKQVDELNTALGESISGLSTILGSLLKRPSVPKIQSLKKPQPTEAIFDGRPDLALGRKPVKITISAPKLGFFARLIPGAKTKHATGIAEEEARASRTHLAELLRYEETSARRTEILNAATAEVHEFNAQIEQFDSAVKQGDAEAVAQYFELILQESEYPYEFAHEYTVAWDNTSKHLVIDCRMPTMTDVIPEVEKYKYTKSTDQIAEMKRAERSSRDLYAKVVAAVSLRVLHEMFNFDTYKLADVVTLNAYVDIIDKSTGQLVKPYILSVRANRTGFEQLNLTQVEPTLCLKRMSALVSRSPAELVPIKPIVDINMLDPRFIKEQNILSSMDNRTNLMTLTPAEFESLITNLFQKMGLETKLTIPSRDGGVDCVAFDQRPILGGKVVIQAKRYKHTVGVSSIRDLFGTMMNEGASKGILVTTSGYGKASFEFANGKPIELISGANLLYLLREHGGIEAKIEPPENWIDFQESSGEIVTGTDSSFTRRWRGRFCPMSLALASGIADEQWVVSQLALLSRLCH